jgi:hypothetical protein
LFQLLPFLTYGPGRARPVENSCACYVLSLFPVEAAIISVRSCVHTGPWNHVASYAENTSAQGIGHSPLDRATVKNSWRPKSTPIFYSVVMNGKSNLTLHKHIRPTCSCLHNFLTMFWDKSMCRSHLTCNLSSFILMDKLGTFSAFQSGLYLLTPSEFFLHMLDVLSETFV